MKLIAIALLSLTLHAQVAEKTIPLPDKIVAGGAPPQPAQFSHEQKDALAAAALQSLVADKQVANAQKAADAANSAYINLLNQLLAKIGACTGAQVDISFSVSCPKP